MEVSKSKYYTTLDGLRGLSIILVLFDMLNLLEIKTGLSAKILNRISAMGWTGVQLFFVLSGFLITGILLDSNRAKNYYSAFYARRTLRIFPLYFLILIISFFILPIFITLPEALSIDRTHQWWLWTYLSNWSGLFGEGSKAFPHFWSLAVEEQFYLLWPLLIHSRDAARTIRLCFILAIASFIIRCLIVWYSSHYSLSYPYIYQNLFCRMDALALGGMAAAALRVPKYKEYIIKNYQNIFKLSLILLVVGFILTHGFWNDTLIGETVGYTIVAIVFTLIVLSAASSDLVGGSRWFSFLKTKPLRSLGKYSYAMYIFHKPLHDYLGKPIALKFDVAHSVLFSALYICLGIGVTFMMAFISWHLFEKYFINFKKYFIPEL